MATACIANGSFDNYPGLLVFVKDHNIRFIYSKLNLNQVYLLHPFASIITIIIIFISSSGNPFTIKKTADIVYTILHVT